MTTTQAAPNGHRVSAPPSVEDPAELNSADLPANQDPINQFATDDQVSSRENHGDPRVKEVEPPFPAGAYHVPPKAFSPSPNLRQPHEYSDGAKRLGTLPGRCQLMFSDGRQCTMARSDIHPSLCVYHSEREEQLFGDPFAESDVRGRTYDLPELFSAARDLSTAAGVNRALAQVFRLLAQRRISREEAATFAKLAHLLLQSIRAAHSSCESHGDQELSHVSSRVPMRTSPENVIPKTTIRPEPSSRVPAHLNSAVPPMPRSSEPLPRPAPPNTTLRTTTTTGSVCNPPYKNTQPDPIHNQHLQ
jgi:hypothetical protein